MSELPEFSDDPCGVFNTFNKVTCDREQGHSGAHLHHYPSGHVCGWGIAGPTTGAGHE